DLQAKILDLDCKIIWEESKQQKLEQQAAQITKAEIDKEANRGIKYFSSAHVIDKEIKSLNDENDVLDTKMAHSKELYNKLKAYF
ncbi:hypothetical protein A2U01_0080835, partial [Trifolium medium]|nr:hypothetical protein [Trifolium medium]